MSLYNHCWGIGRLVQPGAFRASESARIARAREKVGSECAEMALQATKKLGSDCVALDFVYDRKNQPLILESAMDS